jgi:hypothetical protein
MTFIIAYKWFIDSMYDHTNVWLMASFLMMIVVDILYGWHLLSL